MKKRFTFKNQTSDDQEAEHRKNHGNKGPSDSVLKFLLGYSSSLSVIRSEQFGNFNVNLN
ncbi:MAG: hypothetical protein K9G58_10345 [Bacteroidales bacterium]|nr:hypothetical protein [Bacteroidales bacterium]MCF8388048.1 hypothetical protein [Bacteroidales bacterium]MCF8398560.1 hypothetical protein [Bacteroidales bacterium]